MKLDYFSFSQVNMMFSTTTKIYLLEDIGPRS